MLARKKYALSAKAEELKSKANCCFEQANYLEAIELYNLAIQEAGDSPVLHGNRAAALMKRNWDGDFYMALQDCYKALSIDRMHLKSHFRLVKCLFELKWTDEAQECLQIFVKRFPEYANSTACDKLVNDIEERLQEEEKKMEKKKKKKKKKQSEEVSSSESSGSSDNEYDQYLTKRKKKNCSGGGESSPRRKSSEDETGDSRAYKKYLGAKQSAVDFRTQFCGHCNVSTDIKEACFLGE